ncbi:MAG: translation initiation factor 2 [Cypionkella sp.]|jgi:hypothetical protein|nr:translation initiation factor 2 [Cypionkella sp.]
MTPSFALNLTDHGITLLHRTGRGWMDVGHVAFDDPDLTAALEYLRSTALGLSPNGIATKLIIPESQILYMQVDAPGPDEASRRAQIESALDGRTPYTLDELSYDWSEDGARVTVAVVAKETLAEAEAFATEHRFNPVSFVALPQAARFGKEPFFGQTALAASLLPAGERVDPEAAPVTIIAREPQRIEDSAAAAVAPEPVPVAPTPVMAEPDPPVPAPEPEQTPVEVPEPGLPSPVAPEPEMPQPADPEPADPEPDLPEPDLPAPEPDPRPEPAPPAPTPPAPAPQPDPAPAYVPPAPPAYDPPTPPVTLSRPASVLPDEAEAPMAVDVEQEDTAEDAPQPKARVASVLDSKSPPGDDLPPPLSSAALMAFASRRAAEGNARPLGKADAGLPDLTAARPAAPAAARPATAAAKPVVERPAGARPAPKFSYDDPLPPPTRLPGDPPIAAGSVMGKASKGLRSLGTLVTAPTIPGTKKKKTAPPPAPAAAPARPVAAPVASTLAAPAETAPSLASMKAAAQSLSRPKLPTPAPDAIAKGLSARTMPQRGKPRYLGLILTGVLLLVLAIVAAWSSFYLTRSDDTPAEVQVAGVEDEAVADGQIPAPDEEMLADLQAPDDLPEAAPIAAPAPVAAQVAEAEPAPAEPAPQTGVEAVAASANQPNAANQDEIFLAGMDTPPVLSDPLILPQPVAAADALPAAQMPPPPFGTVYQFDADGRIVPTAEGIMTPEGVMLFAGRPARVPPQRPAALVAAAPEASATAPAAVGTAAPVAPAAVETAAPVQGEVLPAETFAADPALGTLRPRLRPEGLVPPAAVTADDDASLAPAADSRFASLRPRARPSEVLAAGEAARRASEAASLATQAAVENAVASAADASLSPLAVSVSRVPAPRPRDLSRAVEAAVAAATRQPAAEPVAAAQPAARPSAVEEEDDEPEVASAAPRIPTRANVAKQATFVNAINLSRLNLIGVYGTQSNRYALVRQANGRYRKVEVGDNLDGGRVQAITASEVRYRKGGRMVSLAMPKG